MSGFAVFSKYPYPAETLILVVIPPTMDIVPPYMTPIGDPLNISVVASVCVLSAKVTESFLVISFSPSTSSRKFQKKSLLALFIAAWFATPWNLPLQVGCSTSMS